jgi:hypothetical protein
VQRPYPVQRVVIKEVVKHIQVPHVVVEPVQHVEQLVVVIEVPDAQQIVTVKKRIMRGQPYETNYNVIGTIISADPVFSLLSGTRCVVAADWGRVGWPRRTTWRPARALKILSNRPREVQTVSFGICAVCGGVVLTSCAGVSSNMSEVCQV